MKNLRYQQTFDNDEILDRQRIKEFIHIQRFAGRPAVSDDQYRIQA